MNNFNSINTICRKFNIALLYVFGSQQQTAIELLNGENLKVKDPLTDIDIGIVFHSELPGPKERYELFSSIYNELEELFLPFPLDIVFLQENHSVFQAKVLCGKCLYYSDFNFKENYEENILRRAADFKPFLERYFDELLEEA